MRDPRRADVEHVARQLQFVVEGTDRCDGAVVDVGDESVDRVEPLVAGVVLA